MNSAIVAMTNDIGAEGRVMETLCHMPSVKECYIVYGVYDILVKVDGSVGPPSPWWCARSIKSKD